MVKRVLCTICCVLVCVFFIQRCLQYGSSSPPSVRGFVTYISDYRGDYFNDTVFSALKEFKNGWDKSNQKYDDLIFSHFPPYLSQIVVFVMNVFSSVINLGYYGVVAVTFIWSCLDYLFNFIFYIFNYFF